MDEEARASREFMEGDYRPLKGIHYDAWRHGEESVEEWVERNARQEPPEGASETLRMVYAAHEPLFRLRHNGHALTYDLGDRLDRALDGIVAATQPGLAIGLGLHDR